MNFDPGRVRIVLQLEDGRISRARVSCERPAVARLLHGRDADQAVALIPLIYSLCGQAQGIAGRAALAAARGMGEAEHMDAAVWAEAAREHAWKLFVDWPNRLGTAVDEAFFVRLIRCAPERRDEFVAALAAHELPSRLLEAAGDGPMAEQFSCRVTARLNELNDWLENRPGILGKVAATHLSQGIGQAWVETARGQLLHRIELDGERIVGYAIAAPTDVNFSADGEVTARLALLQGMTTEEAKRAVMLLALAFDPCVPWEYRIE